jgi:hypothetical protein
VAVEKASRRSGDVVKTSSFLEVAEVIQQACWAIPRAWEASVWADGPLEYSISVY